MDPVKLRAERWQLRSAAVGALLLGSVFLYEGIRAHAHVVNNKPDIDKSSLFSYAVTSQPMPFIYTVEGAGILGLGFGAAAAYGARRITRQLREE